MIIRNARKQPYLGVPAHAREQFARQPVVESQTLIGRARGDGKEAGRVNAHVRGVAALGREFVGARGATGGQRPNLRERNDERENVCEWEENIEKTMKRLKEKGDGRKVERQREIEIA